MPIGTHKMFNMKNSPATFPPAFSSRMKKQLGTAWEAFVRAHQQTAPVSIRINPQKKAEGQLFPQSAPIPWCNHGRFLPERPKFSNDPLWHAGAYYVQEASSMLLCHVLKQLKIQKSITALDLGAAPGGKSTILLDHLPKGSLLLCNEPIHSRLTVLKENLARWGRSNVLVSQHKPQEIAQTGLHFDLILIDAPCSGEGLFRKQPEAMKHWSHEQAEFCALRQKNILKDILPALVPGGYLIYSTCTYNPAENEHQVKELLQNGLEEVSLAFPKAWQIENRTHGYQCYPHLFQGEGFFLSVMKKTDINSIKQRTRNKTQNWKTTEQKLRRQINELLPATRSYVILENPRHGIFALPPELVESATSTLSRLPRCRPITDIIRKKGSLILPTPAAALQVGWEAGIRQHHLTEKEAHDFLQGRPLSNPDQLKGLLLARFRGLSLGWVKAVPGRMNLLKAK